MANAIVATAFGGPEVLSLVPLDDEVPGPGQVLVEVRAAGVNPFDYKRYSGAYGADPAQLPMRLGSEAAGVVRAVGAGAQGAAGEVRTGDEVIVYPASGAYASELVVPGASVVAKPASLSFAQAGGLLLTGSTAAHALTVAGVGPGDTVVVHGASGGVGLMAVQLAVIAGARVIGTASEANHDVLRGLGVEPVTYGPGLAERLAAMAPDGADAAIDAIGTEEALTTSLSLVPDRDRIVTAVNFQKALDLGLKAIGQGPGGDPGTAIRAAARSQLARLAGEGRLQVFVAGTYALAQAADAHRAVMSGHTRGKIILVP